MRVVHTPSTDEETVGKALVATLLYVADLLTKHAEFTELRGLQEEAARYLEQADQRRKDADRVVLALVARRASNGE